eukprot:SAG31_NODE_45301_length_259_cov_0.956250_1_plen_47_part_10
MGLLTTIVEDKDFRLPNYIVVPMHHTGCPLGSHGTRHSRPRYYWLRH